MLKYLIDINTLISIDVLKESLLLVTTPAVIDYLIYLGNQFKYDFPTVTDLNKGLITIASTGNIVIFDYLVSLGSDWRALLII